MSNEKLSFIRGPLKLIGLSDEAIEKVIDFISDLLFEKDEKSSKVEYPYHLVDEFISPLNLISFSISNPLSEIRLISFQK